MKKTTIIFTTMSITIVLAVTVFWTAIGLSQTENKSDEISFVGKSNQESYILGEPITTEFRFTNEGKLPVLVAGYGVESGGLKIVIARGGDGEYKEYFGSGWGRLQGKYITLEPKQSFKLSQATILWNGKPNVSHLNQTAANRVLKGKITTEYALPEPGIYFIKGRSYVGGDATPIESEPVRIAIHEPTGDDLEVWNKIKGDREIAFLLQKASFNTGKEERKQELIAQVEQILVLHPNSVYSSYLKPNLQKYKENEAKRDKAFKK